MWEWPTDLPCQVVVKKIDAKSSLSTGLVHCDVRKFFLHKYINTIATSGSMPGWGKPSSRFLLQQHCKIINYL